jgi:hypothetical protein
MKMEGMGESERPTDPSTGTADGTQAVIKAVDDSISRYVLVLFQGGGRRDPLGQLDRDVLGVVQQKLDAVVKSEPEKTEVDVWLESPGGDAHSAYKLFLDLRSRSSKLRVVIPDYAKSAATLFALGTDEIYMAPAAELGPLDMQMEHPDREGTWISALDATRALDYIAEFASEYILAEGGNAHDRTGLPRLDVFKEFSRFAALFFQPLVAKLDPQLVHQAANGLDVGRRYAITMLTQRTANSKSDQPGNNPEEIARHFVDHYPAHEFVISRLEARNQGLPVFWAEEYNFWYQAKSMWRSYRAGGFAREVAGTKTKTAIEVLSEHKVQELSDAKDDESEGDEDVAEN